MMGSAEIDGLRGTPGGEQQIFRELWPPLMRWARGLARKHGDRFGSHAEDVVDETAERLLAALRSAVEPRDWASYAYGVTTQAARSYYRSSAVTVASGMDAIKRHERVLARAQAEQRMALGSEPTAAEVADAANARVAARRADPSKQRRYTPDFVHEVLDRRFEAAVRRSE